MFTLIIIINIVHWKQYVQFVPSDIIASYYE